MGDNSLFSQDKLSRIKRKFHPQLAVSDIGPHTTIQCIWSESRHTLGIFVRILMGLGLLLVLDVPSPRTFHYVEGRAPIGPSEDSSSPLWSLCP